ncbi:MAG: DUF945 domain-containing protein [Candidatus Omnitrophica bacterium]|nr:DUF945 domain-containing protein [Candidatus Omnitrophota bacterium]
MKKTRLAVVLAIIIGIALGMSWYIYGRYFSEKTENPFKVNPAFSIIVGVAISVGVVIYWRKDNS